MPLDAKIDPAILQRFELGEKIGEGSYGVVFRAINKKTREVFALKKQVDAFRNRKDAQRTMREVLTLRKLFGTTKYLISLHEVFRGSDDKDIYMILDCMDSDLTKVPMSDFSDDQRSLLVYQMLAGLAILHDHECLHRDIKPSNLLWRKQGNEVKLGDLGLARTISSLELENEDEDPEDIHNSTGSLWYMAPEALLGSHVASKPSDVWAIGCCVGEMFLQNPLFKGSSKNDVLCRITQLVGRPDAAYIKELEDGGNLPAALVIERFPASTCVDFKSYMSCSEDAADLLKKLLEFDPSKRISAREALSHPWLKRHQDQDNYTPENPVKLLKLPFDGPEEHSVEDYKQAVYSEIETHYTRKKSGFMSMFPCLGGSSNKVSPA